MSIPRYFRNKLQKVINRIHGLCVYSFCAEADADNPGISSTLNLKNKYAAQTNKAEPSKTIAPFHNPVIEPAEILPGVILLFEIENVGSKNNSITTNPANAMMPFSLESMDITRPNKTKSP